jgi:hypothetical protein
MQWSGGSYSIKKSKRVCVVSADWCASIVLDLNEKVMLSAAENFELRLLVERMISNGKRIPLEEAVVAS